jgi:hypothetical protein
MLHRQYGAGLWEPLPNGIPARANAAEANLFVKSDPGFDTPDLHIWNIEAPYVSESHNPIPIGWALKCELCLDIWSG